MTLFTFSRPETYFSALGVNFLNYLFNGGFSWISELVVGACFVVLAYVIIQVGFRGKLEYALHGGITVAILSALVWKVQINISEQKLKHANYHPVFASVDKIETREVPLLFALPAAVIDSITGSMTMIADLAMGAFEQKAAAESTQRRAEVAGAAVTDERLSEEIGSWVRQCFRQDLVASLRTTPKREQERVLNSLLGGVKYQPSDTNLFGGRHELSCRDAKTELNGRLTAWAGNRRPGESEDVYLDRMDQMGGDLGTEQVSEQELVIWAVADAAEKEIASTSMFDNFASWAMTQIGKAFAAVVQAFIKVLRSMFTLDFFSIMHGIFLMLITACFAPYALFSIFPGGHKVLYKYCLYYLWVSSWPLFFFFLSQMDRIVGVLGDSALSGIGDPFVFALINGGDSIFGLSPVTSVDILQATTAFVGAVGTFGLPFYSWWLIRAMAGRIPGLV